MPGSFDIQNIEVRSGNDFHRLSCEDQTTGKQNIVMLDSGGIT